MYNEMFIVVISGEWNHNEFSFSTFYVGNICHFYNTGTLLETGNKNYNVEWISADAIHFLAYETGLIMF